MKIRNAFYTFALLTTVSIIAGCSSKTDPAPAAPASTKAVHDFVNGKKLVVKQLGFYKSFTVNNAKEIDWLDMANEKDEMTKNAATEEMGLVLQFINDTAVSIFKKEKPYTGTYAVTDKLGNAEDEQPGIKLKISFSDPDFGFGDTPVNVTYTYPVLGLDLKRIMLETPRSINRRKLITMMTE